MHSLNMVRIASNYPYGATQGLKAHTTSSLPSMSSPFAPMCTFACAPPSTSPRRSSMISSGKVEAVITVPLGIAELFQCKNNKESLSFFFHGPLAQLSDVALGRVGY